MSKESKELGLKDLAFIAEMGAPKQQLSPATSIDFSNPGGAALNLILHIIEQAATKKRRDADVLAHRKIDNEKFNLLSKYLENKERKDNERQSYQQNKEKREQDFKEAVEHMRRKDSARDFGQKREEFENKKNKFGTILQLAIEKNNRKIAEKEFEDKRREENEKNKRKQDYYYDVAKKLSPDDAQIFLQAPENYLPHITKKNSLMGKEKLVLKMPGRKKSFRFI